MEKSRNDLLKIIAMITMLIDHIGVLLLPEVSILRTIGRIAFPIFAYQLAKGFAKTSNRKKYAFRIFIFGLLAQGPYMFLNYEFQINPFHFNVMLYFLYALGMLKLWELCQAEFRLNRWVRASFYSIAFIAIVLLPEILQIQFDTFAFSYSTYGLLMILLFYIGSMKNYVMVVGYLLLTVASTYLSGGEILSKYSLQWVGKELTVLESLQRFEVVWENITTYKNGLMHLDGYFLQARSLMGLALILLLREREMSVRLNKWVAYIFYPLHIGILVMIRYLMDMLA